MSGLLRAAGAGRESARRNFLTLLRSHPHSNVGELAAPHIAGAAAVTGTAVWRSGGRFR